MSAPERMLGRVAVALLAFAAGFADTAGFLGLDHLFTAHVTGNLALLGAQLVLGEWDGALARTIVFPVFGIAVAAASVFVRCAHNEGRPAAEPLLLVESALLALAALAAALTLGRHLATHEAPAVTGVAVLTVAGMGIQNAVMRLAYRSEAQTTVMTGNLTHMATDIATVLFTKVPGRDAQAVADAGERLRAVVPAASSFVLGAAAGAILTRELGVTSLALPALVVFSLGVRERRRPTS